MTNSVENQTIPRTTRVFNATYANLPTAQLREGELGYATDRKVLYRWSGAAWVSLTIYTGIGNEADAPAAATLPDGSFYYCSDTSKYLQVSGGAWVTGWSAANFARRNSGTYTGNDAANRSISTSLGRVPYLVLITGGGYWSLIMYGYGGFIWWTIPGTANGSIAVTTPTTSAFYVGNATNYGYSMNASGIPYTWVVIG